MTGKRAAAAERARRTIEGDILLAATPAAWVDAAVANWQALLLDHANCEKKAASTALALIFAYPEDRALAVSLSRLAREELKHFEQVERLMRRLEVPYKRQKPSRYASELRKLVRTHEPARKLDLMLMHALIEARSCERFRLLAGRLPKEVSTLYAQLEVSEARHYEIYLEFAAREFSSDEIAARMAPIASREAELITSADGELKFHSGVPA
jgi:tRNA 2-(methylsulfanyl)-N6-isopentenyladenosine37 hydroxylase